MQMLGQSASGHTVPWQSASMLSRLHLSRPARLVHPDVQDAIFFFFFLMDEYDVRMEVRMMRAVTTITNKIRPEDRCAS